MQRKTKRRPTTKRSSAELVRGFYKSPPHVSQNRILQATRVYLMHNVPFFFLNKFGITDHTKARVKNVSETTPGFVFNFFAPRLEFGYQLEQFIHALYRLQNVQFWTGSGRREWFVVFSPVVGTLVLAWSIRYQVPLAWKTYGLAYFMPFVWLDGLFWLAIFSALRIAAVLAVVLGFIYFFAHV